MINKKAEFIYSQSMRTDMLDFLPEEYSRVLEVGCNVGNFRLLASKPCEYWGVEPSSEAADIAKTRMDKVLVGFYDEIANEIPDNYFDLIIANDVIEHLENPWNFLHSIKKKMAANACVVFSIPNVRFYGNLKELLWEKDWKYKDEGILDITHLRFFTEKSIVRLLNENGFEIKKICGINPGEFKKRYLLFYWLIKFIFGSDTKFMHFGIKAKIRGSSFLSA